MAPCPQLLLIKCVGGRQCQGEGRRAELVLALRAHPGPAVQRKVLGVVLWLCAVAQH